MKIIFLFVFLFQIVFSSSKININNFPNEELVDLPITYEQQVAIIDFIDDRGYISSIYELLDIPEISSKELEILKKIFIIELPKVSDVQKKISSRPMNHADLEI